MKKDIKESSLPLQKFYFQMKIGDIEGAFQEVSGLSIETSKMEYRHADLISDDEKPDLKEYTNVTLKRGIMAKNHVHDLQSQMQIENFQKNTMVISLLDESGNPAMTWMLKDTFPVKMTGPDLNGEGNNVAIENLVLVHNGITVGTKDDN